MFDTAFYYLCCNVAANQSECAPESNRARTIHVCTANRIFCCLTCRRTHSFDVRDRRVCYGLVAMWLPLSGSLLLGLGVVGKNGFITTGSRCGRHTQMCYYSVAMWSPNSPSAPRHQIVHERHICVLPSVLFLKLCILRKIC